MNTRTPEELLARMTWSEKLAQLQIIWRRDEDDALALARGGVGALFWPQSAERTNALQRAAIEQSAHGIPLLIGLDVIHGQFTIFPTPLAQAASFDPSVAAADARVSAGEARSGGVNWTFSPMVDVTRDPRWGRVVEGFGEDAFLAAALGAAKVRAYQGDDLSASDAVAACLKHFVAYGAAEAGRDYNTTDVSRRRLRETYLEPFRAGVAAGAASVMAAFNSLNGTPMHAHRRLLTDVLKTEYGFDGVVVGDADGVAQLVAHGVARDEADAVRQSLSAGLDIVMGGSELAVDGVPLIEPSAVDAARIDDAVLRILRLKKALGLFENPFADAATERSAPTGETLQIAQEAAERCIVLLKNDERMLPLAPATQRILLTGPYATSTDHLGAWVQHFGAHAGTLDHALRAALPDATWTVAPGADFLEPSDADIREAAALAAENDLVIVAVGEPSSISGEASSRADIRLPGDQERLIHAIADTGGAVRRAAHDRPSAGRRGLDRPRPRGAPDLASRHPRTRGDRARRGRRSESRRSGADDLSPRSRADTDPPRRREHRTTGTHGRIDGGGPLGRRSAGAEQPRRLLHVEVPRSRARAAVRLRARAQLYDVPRGGGIPLDPADLSLTIFAPASRVTVSVTVRNVGERDGDDVVLVYLSDPVASLAQPVQRLRGFRRVAVAAGEAASVSFELGAEELGFWDDEDLFVVEPGELVLTITDGTDDERLGLSVTR